MPIRLYKRYDLSENKIPPLDMTLNSASSISIGYQHIAEKEEAKKGGRYNRIARGYSSGKLPNGKNMPPEKPLFLQGM